MIRSRSFVALSTLGMASLLLLSACGASASPSAPASGGAQAKPGGPPPAPVTTAKAQNGPITAGITFTGDVTASQQVNLAPKVAGLVVKLMADVGQHVTAGQQVAELDHMTQDAALAQAQAQLEVAKASQAKILAQGRPEEVAKANATVAQQQAKLDALNNQGRPETVAQAQANLDTANAKLQAIQAGTDQQTIANDRAALDTAQQKLAILVSPEQVDAFRQAVATAKNTLYSNQIARDASCAGVNGPAPATGKGSTCQAAQAAVNSAQTAVDQANDTLAINTDPGTIAQSQNAVKQAQATLDKDLATAPSNLQQAQAAVVAAQNALAVAQNPNLPTDVAQQQALVNSAQQALKEAATPFVQSDLDSAQASVDAAKANVDVAAVNQQLTQVVAPFNGVISARLLSEGALASTTVPVFTIVSDDVEVDLPVAQEQLSQVKEGLPAQLSTPALAGQTIDGKIASVSPAADPKSRTFLVRVVPTTQDGKLKPGMSAAVVIATQSKDNALLIPRDAVTADPTSGKQGVFTVDNGPNGQVAVFKTPTFGVSDNTNIEVVSGLNPGDIVIVSGQGAIANNQRVRLTDSQASAGASASGKPQASGAAGSAKPQASGQSAG